MNDNLDPITGRRVPGDQSWDYASADAPSEMGDDTNSPRRAEDDSSGATGQAKAVASDAAQAVGQVKDVAAERGGDVVATAQDEFARVAGEARAHAQNLWSQASTQLREQASTGQQQAADFIHGLASELGHLASRSEQNGPITALARQASNRGGAFAHWLAESDSHEVLVEIRRFARRRPFVFLAGATVAGVLVGRLSRGLMAEADTSLPSTSSQPSLAGGSVMSESSTGQLAESATAAEVGDQAGGLHD